MSQRLQIVLPDPIAAQLKHLSAQTQEPPSTVAGQMVRAALAQVDAAIDPRPAKARASLDRQNDARAPWLEPYGGDPDWSQRMWGSILALYGRYPHHLQALKEGWWTDESQTETLCAFALWRAQIDDAGDDPRQELAFQAELDHYARALREQAAGVSKAWKPGAPPVQWIER